MMVKQARTMHGHIFMVEQEQPKEVRDHFDIFGRNLDLLSAYFLHEIFFELVCSLISSLICWVFSTVNFVGVIEGFLMVLVELGEKFWISFSASFCRLDGKLAIKSWLL